MTTRRQALALGACLLAAPVALAQQKSRVWRVGFLSLSSRPPVLEQESFAGFVRGMRELGYVEGKNLVIDWRFAENSTERMAALASELVGTKPDVIVTVGVPPTAALKKVTTTIPIVMGTATDPLGAGLVASLARPGGNITGLSNVAVDLGPKHLEIMLSVVPKLSRVAVLLNPDTSSNAAIFKQLNVEAQKRKIATVPAEAVTATDIDRAFQQFAREGAGALVVALAPLFTEQRRHIAALALKNKLPSVASIWQFAEAGGLVTYGPNLAEYIRRAATYVDKIFKGAKPSDLPIEQPTAYETVINRGTAKALGISIPQELLLRADRVVE